MNGNLQSLVVPDKALPGETQVIPIWGFVLRQQPKEPASELLSDLTHLYTTGSLKVDDLATESLSKFLGNSWGSFGQRFIGVLRVICCLP
jgi:hypothetical protein